VSDIRGDRRYAGSGCGGAVWKSKRHWTGRIVMHFQVDGENLNNRLNIIDFCGRFQTMLSGQGEVSRFG